jgi:phage repressor protein C with HTH and peptisase S24 domain
MSRGSENAKTDRSYSRTAADRAAFVGRLQTILRHWPSADRLARATGVSPSAFRKWLKGEAEPSRERLVALAEAASVGIAWLASGEGPEPRFQTVGKTPGVRGANPPSVAGLPREQFVLLPKRPEAAAAGPETPNPPSGAEFIAIRNDWVRSVLGVEPEHLLLQIAIGQSMQPSIQDGDLLFVDTSENKFGNFGVYVLEVGGERLVKRVQPKLDGSLTLISDNAAYEAEHLPPSQAAEVHVVGRVLWICGPLRGSG